MLSRLVCRNGLHKHDFWEIIKSKIRHSYEAHTYLRHIGFASLAGQTFEEGKERLVTVVDFPCARGISLTALLTCCHETNVR